MDGESAPEESGTTTEEQPENDIEVEAVDEAAPEDVPEQEGEDEQDMAEELDEAIRMLEALRDTDPENVGAIGLVVNTKNGMPQEAVEAKKDPQDVDPEDLPDGTTWRVVNSDLDGYDDVDDVVATLAAFNDGLDQAEVQMERPSGPAGLFGGLLGAE